MEARVERPREAGNGHGRRGREEVLGVDDPGLRVVGHVVDLARRLVGDQALFQVLHHQRRVALQDVAVARVAREVLHLAGVFLHIDQGFAVLPIAVQTVLIPLAADHATLELGHGPAEQGARRREDIAVLPAELADQLAALAM